MREEAHSRRQGQLAAGDFLGTRDFRGTMERPPTVERWQPTTTYPDPRTHSTVRRGERMGFSPDNVINVSDRSRNTKRSSTTPTKSSQRPKRAPPVIPEYASGGTTSFAGLFAGPPPGYNGDAAVAQRVARRDKVAGRVEKRTLVAEDAEDEEYEEVVEDAEDEEYEEVVEDAEDEEYEDFVFLPGLDGDL
jgi:hypothetical protein